MSRHYRGDVFVIGLFAQQYHEYFYAKEGFFSRVSSPLYPVGVGLIIGAVFLFIIGFYQIIKEKIHT